MDDFEPAITDSTTGADTGAESAPIVKRDAASPAAAAQVAANADARAADESGELETGGPRGQRVISDKVRAMFKTIAASHAGEDLETGEDLVPMVADTPSPPAAVAPVPAVQPAQAVTPPAHSATPAAAAPSPPAVQLPAPDVGRAAIEQAKLLNEMRDKELAAREARIVEREKLMPDRAALAERPAETLMTWLKESWGVTDDAEMTSALTDLVTELSEKGLKVQLPEEVKTKLESRKALRSVKAYQAQLAGERKALEARQAELDKAQQTEREKQEQAQRERQAIATVTGLVAGTKESHRFLHAQENPAGIVVEVIREQLRRNQPADWEAAAKFADDYYRSEAEAHVKRAAHLQSLLAPAAPAPAAAAPAKAAPAPGGASGPAPRTPATPAPQQTVTDEDDSTMDRHERRARSLRKIARAKGLMPTP